MGSRGHMVHTLASGSILKPPEHPFCVRSTVGQTSRNCASFELQLHDSNPVIFGKNHFQHPNVLFYHGSDFTFGRFTPSGITCLRPRFGQNLRGAPTIQK